MCLFLLDFCLATNKILSHKLFECFFIVNIYFQTITMTWMLLFRVFMFVIFIQYFVLVLVFLLLFLTNGSTVLVTPIGNGIFRNHLTNGQTHIDFEKRVNFAWTQWKKPTSTTSSYAILSQALITDKLKFTLKSIASFRHVNINRKFEKINLIRAIYFSNFNLKEKS